MRVRLLSFTCYCRAGGAGPTTPTLVGPKILSFMVKALYFQSYGRTNNCQIEVHFQMVGPILHSFRRPCIALRHPLASLGTQVSIFFGTNDNPFKVVHVCSFCRIIHQQAQILSLETCYSNPENQRIVLMSKYIE